MIIISVIVPILNEEDYIQECIESIINFNYPKKYLEILFIDGMSTDNTLNIINQYQKKYSYIKVIENIDKIVPSAMNLGIKIAKGDYICRLDAHAKYPSNYISKLLEWSITLDADNVGAVVLTEVKNINKKSNSIKAVLSHRLGVGNSDFRTSTDSIKEVDTVPFGCYPKSVFEKYGYYDERLIRNQDIELNKRIINSGGKIYLVPDIKCTYFARENFIALAKNNYSNGFWNILTAHYTKTFNSLSLRHFVPLIFVVSLLFPLLLSFIFPQAVWLSFLSLISYLSLVIIISIKLKNSSNSIIYLIMSFLTLHFSYGLGSLMGIFSIINKSIKGEK